MTSHTDVREAPATGVDAYTSTRPFTPGTVVMGFLDGGSWSACFGLSYRDLCLYDVTHSERVIRPNGRELRAVTGTGGIPQSRNKVAHQFLTETDGEWLLFVDTDMGFSADTADRLVESASPEERPVVGGLCFAGIRTERTKYYAERYMIQPTIYQWVTLPDEVGFAPMHDYARNSMVEASATGAACLLIHFTALERVRAQYGETWFDPITHPTGNKGGKPRTFSEDMSFCIRLAGVDIPVYVNTAVKTTHEKGQVYLDEETYEFSRK